METKLVNQPLAEEIIATAQPRFSLPVALTPQEKTTIARLVETEVRAAVDSYGATEPRCEFTLAPESKKGIEACIRLQLFPNDPRKQREAQAYSSALLSDWIAFVRRSELFKMLRDSSEAVFQDLHGTSQD